VEVFGDESLGSRHALFTTWVEVKSGVTGSRVLERTGESLLASVLVGVLDRGLLSLGGDERRRGGVLDGLVE
jgi:hypothetical protein